MTTRPTSRSSASPARRAATTVKGPDGHCAGDCRSHRGARGNSFNGEIGVPLTVCRITPTTRYLVAEMGARGLGHLEYSRASRPADRGRAQRGRCPCRRVRIRREHRDRQGRAAAGRCLNDRARRAFNRGRRARERHVWAGRPRRLRRRAQTPTCVPVDVTLDAWARPRPGCSPRCGCAWSLSRGAIRWELAGRAGRWRSSWDWRNWTRSSTLAIVSPVSRWRMGHRGALTASIVNDACNANRDSMGAALARTRHHGRFRAPDCGRWAACSS